VSKYRIEFKASRQRYYFLVAFYCLLLISVFSWQANIVVYQVWIQLFSAILVVMAAVVAFKNTDKYNQAFVALVSQQGDWTYLSQQNNTSWQLSQRSRLTSWILWIHISAKIGVGQSRWHWIFKDQVSERDYRRLCRCILYQQHKTHSSEV
jgi:uncharacterized membrane protein YeiB